MALRIEFYRGTEKVMAVSCLKSIAEAIKDAQTGLRRFDADKAVIVDMDANGKALGTISREEPK